MTITQIPHVSVLKIVEPLLVDGFHPLRPSFTPQATARLLICPIENHLTESEFSHLCGILRKRGEDSFVLARIGRFAHKYTDWIVPCDDFKAYDALGVGEALICSRSGDWALLLSIDGHAIAGAHDREFIDALGRELSVTSEESAENLLDYWRDLVPLEFDVRWIPGLLRHVLGEPDASDLLARNAEWLGMPRTDT